MKLPHVLAMLYSVLWSNHVLAYFYPPLFWHKDSCGFSQIKENMNNNGTKEYFVRVIPSSGMNVVCPNYVTVNSWLQEAGLSVSNPTLNENIWLVDKKGYDHCIVNEKGDPKFNRLFLLCDKPLEVKYKSFVFHPNFNYGEPKFLPGHHYYFISTSRGYKKELSTRKVSGSHGSCQRYHMKLHIYVCDMKKEDCFWEMPRCDPPANLRRDMLSIDGKLPYIGKTATLPVVIPKPTSKTVLKKTKNPHPKFIEKDPNYQKEPTLSGLENRNRICHNKKNGMSIQLILNFVLGGVAIFMAVVIIILVCGLSSKSKRYTVERPTSTVPSSHDPGNYIYGETVRYSDGHAHVSLVSPTPPTSPQFIVIQPALPSTSQSSDTDRPQFVFPTNPRQSSSAASAEASTTKSEDDLQELESEA